MRSLFRVIGCCGIVIEFLKVFELSLHVRGWRDQVCDPKMVSALSLTEARARNGHDAGLVHHFSAVDEVYQHSIQLPYSSPFLKT